MTMRHLKVQGNWDTKIKYDKITSVILLACSYSRYMYVALWWNIHSFRTWNLAIVSSIVTVLRRRMLMPMLSHEQTHALLCLCITEPILHGRYTSQTSLLRAKSRSYRRFRDKQRTFLQHMYIDMYWSITWLNQNVNVRKKSLLCYTHPYF